MRFAMFRGATAYEAQIGPIWLRFVHLRGGGWIGAKLRDRISMGWDQEDTEGRA